MSVINAIQAGADAYINGIVGASNKYTGLEDGKPVDDQKLKEEQTKEAQRREELLDETVLAVSGDGDTATAGKEAIEALSEGIVIKKDDSMEGRSLTGYTESQVESLYKQGKLDYSDYNKELEKRERLAEIQGTDTKDKEAEDKKAEEADFAIEKADLKVMGEKTDVKAEDEKAYAVEDDDKASERRAEILEDEKQSMENFSTVMNGLDGVAREDRLQSAAYDKAIENDRVKVMQDIFTGQKG